MLAKVQARLEGLDLLKQPLGELVPCANRQARDIVDGLVAVKGNALATRVGQHIDDVSLKLKQAELEHLKQAHRTGADDQCIGFDERWGAHGCAWR